MDILNSVCRAGVLCLERPYVKQTVLALGIGVGTKLIYNHFRNASTQSKAAYPPDKVILHQFVRAKLAPNISPFPLKVETYLRINKIPYESEFKKPLGPLGKSPWITYNNEVIPDSQFILEFLNKEFKIDMNHHLIPADKAIAKAFRHLLEDNLYWTAVYNRWVHNNGQGVWDLTGWPTSIKGRIMFAFARKRLSNQCWAQGMGRFSREQIQQITYNHIKALSEFLGDKPYLMGDKICEEDCSLFGFVVQIVYHPHGMEDDSKKAISDFPNIVSYCERIKKEYWPDWDECLKRPKIKS